MNTNRREFLKESFWLGAAATLAGCRTSGTDVMSDSAAETQAAEKVATKKRFEVGVPCLQSPGETTMGVSWAVSGLAKGVVEYADNPEFRGVRTARSGGYGLVPIDDAALQVRLEGLKPSTRYWYRTVTTPFTSYENIYDAKLGEPIVSEAHSFTTLGANSAAHFCVINDTHAQWKPFEMAVSKVKALAPTTVVWNGDATNTTQDKRTATEIFLNPPIASMDWCPISRSASRAATTTSAAVGYQRRRRSCSRVIRGSGAATNGTSSGISQSGSAKSR